MANHCTALDDEFPFRMRASFGMFEAKTPERGKRCGLRMPPSRGRVVTVALVLQKTKTLSSHRIAMEKTVIAGGHLTAYRYDRTPSARPNSTRRGPEANRLNATGHWRQSCVCESASPWRGCRLWPNAEEAERQ